MNYYPNSYENPDQPAPEGQHYIDSITAAAPDTDAADRVTQAFARHGTAFAVYLGLPDIDPYDQDIETSFWEHHVGTYEDRDALVDDTIDTFGWNRELDQLLVDHPLLRSVVAIVRDAVWEHVTDRFDIVAIGHQLYAYER